MQVTGDIHPMPEDPDLPGASALIGSSGLELAVAYLAAQGFTVMADRAVQALYYPGRSMLVRRATWATNGVGEPVRFSICSVIEREADDDPGGEPETWSYPSDPGLPGLAAAVDGSVAEGWAGAYMPGMRNLAIHPVSYRPRRRAVLRYDLRGNRGSGRNERTLFVKAMTPRDAERTWQMSQALRGTSVPLALPVERPDETLLAFDGLPGTQLRQLLLEGKTLPSPERVIGLFDQIAELQPLRELKAKRAVRSGLRHARRVLRVLLPETGERVSALSSSIKELLSAYPVEPQPIHGDFHEAQVMVGDDFNLSLLDLDDMGLGDPAQDAATICGHLVALADSFPAAAERVMAYRGMLRAGFMQRFDLPPAGFAAREAAVMLQLAAGPFRVLEAQWPERVERRIGLAEALLRDETASTMAATAAAV